MTAANIGGLWGVEIYKSFNTDSEVFSGESPRDQNDCSETRARAYKLLPGPGNTEKFADDLTYRIFQKCQVKLDSSLICREGNQFLLRAGSKFYTGSQEQIDQFFTLWQEHPTKDASSVAQAPEILLTHLPNLGAKKLTKEFTPRSVKIFSPNTRVFILNKCVSCVAKKKSRVDELNLPLNGDLKSQISVTAEAQVSVDPESGRNILELQLNQLTAALIKPLGCFCQNFKIYQDRLSVIISSDNPELSLIYRSPGDHIREVQHQFNEEKETGLDATLSLDPGSAGLEVGVHKSNLNTHSVGLTIKDFEGYLKGTDGWDFKLKQVTDAKGSKVSYSGDCEIGIRETLLTTSGCFYRILGRGKKLLTLPEQAMCTLNPPECVKKWQVDQSFKDEVTVLVQIEQRVVYIDQKSKFDTLACKLELPVKVNFANFNIDYGDATLEIKETPRQFPILGR